MKSWLLPQHVHLCAWPDAAVLLDVRADRYHGLTRDQSAALAQVVRGWPCAPDHDTCCDDGRAQCLANDLARQGLLTTDEALGKSAAGVSLPRVEAQLRAWDGPDWSRLRAAHAGAFTVACARAALTLRLRSFQHAIERVRHRKSAELTHALIDCDEGRELTDIFRTLRPLFYTSLDRCLFDSLVLIEFLAQYDWYPNWVIGVRAAPFAAHSWVQADQYVLNGAPTYVRSFTPILAV
jgi:hypothetical protein